MPGPLAAAASSVTQAFTHWQAEARTPNSITEPPPTLVLKQPGSRSPALTGIKSRALPVTVPAANHRRYWARHQSPGDSPGGHAAAGSGPAVLPGRLARANWHRDRQVQLERCATESRSRVNLKHSGSVRFQVRVVPTSHLDRDNRRWA